MRLFTQLWASLQSGEADGGVHRHPRLGIAHTYTMQIMKFEASNGTLSLSNNALTYKKFVGSIETIVSLKQKLVEFGKVFRHFL